MVEFSKAREVVQNLQNKFAHEHDTKLEIHAVAYHGFEFKRKGSTKPPELKNIFADWFNKNQAALNEKKTPEPLTIELKSDANEGNIESLTSMVNSVIRRHVVGKYDYSIEIEDIFPFGTHKPSKVESLWLKLKIGKELAKKKP